MQQGKISVVIADDESLSREALEHYLSEREAFELLASCKDGAEALTTIQTLKPDFVLLDIEMPEMNGLEIAHQIENTHIVFITAFEQYAVKAFEENAIDYVLKPINQKRFDKMLDRIIEAKHREGFTTEQQNKIQELLSKEEKYLKKITTKQKGVITFTEVNSIVSIESEGSFTKLHLSKRFELCNLSISQLEQLLDPKQFVRVQKSFIINIDEIQSMESYFHGEYMITMSNGTTVKLSRGYKQHLDRIINQYL